MTIGGGCKGTQTMSSFSGIIPALDVTFTLTAAIFFGQRRLGGKRIDDEHASC